jgi:L-lactate dehydrogenase complex protein LldG
MRKAFSLVKKRQKANAVKISDFEGRKKRLKEVRCQCIGNEALLEQAIENLRRNGIKVYLAKNKEEAILFTAAEIDGAKLVVKSKSNLTKEIGLTEALKPLGVKAVETDIGDRIIQLCGGVPSHPTGPASHLSRHDIAGVLSHHLGKKVESTPEELVEQVKNEIAIYLNEARIGITGANAIVAEEGAILLIHNEGNIIQVTTRPGKHIVLAGTDKIYPNIEEAINMLKLQTFYATGSLSTSFINIISGASQTADIEKKLIKGVHGPKEICLILVDNYRSDIANSEYKELLSCIGCGQCLLVCPAYAVYGSEFGNDSQLGGKGVLYSALSDGAAAQSDDGLNICLSCRKCLQNCPVDIDTPSMIAKLRLERQKVALEPHLATAYNFVASHLEWIGHALWLEGLLLASKFLQEPDNGHDFEKDES